MRLRILLCYVILSGFAICGVNWEVVSSTGDQLVIDYYFDTQTTSDLAPVHSVIGIPSSDYPIITIEYGSVVTIPTGLDGPEAGGINWVHKQRLRNLDVAVLQVSPGTGDGKYYQHIRVTVHFSHPVRRSGKPDKADSDFMMSRIINYSVARNWHSSRLASTKSAAVYPDGTWIKFSIDEDGIYSIPQNMIADLALPGTPDPRSFMLFTNGRLGRDLSKKVATYNQPNPENLVELAIEITGEADGQLDDDDKIIFWGQGASGFDLTGNTVSHHQSIYYEDNNYWLLIPDDSDVRGKRIQSTTYSGTGNIPISSATVYRHEETDLVNPFSGGPVWVGSTIPNGSTYILPVQINNPSDDRQPEFQFTMLGAGEYNVSHRINVYLQSTQNNIGYMSWSNNTSNSKTIVLSTVSLNNGVNTVIMENSSSSTYSSPHFDKLIINYARNLVYEGDPFDFYVEGNPSPQQASFTTSSDAIIWDITTPATPILRGINSTADGFTADLNIPSDSTKHLVVFSNDDIESVTALELIGSTSFSTLRHTGAGVEHLIIGPESYREALEPLVEHRGSSLFAPLEQVYQEFAGGNPDPLAIRLFIQWTQEVWTGTRPTCLFLVGDADYDYRNITGKSRLIVPTIELPDSYEGNYCTDDRLVTLYDDDLTDTSNRSLPELAIGRYPARSISDVENYVEKLLDYEQNPEPGIWRQRVTLVADDAARPEPNSGSISTGKSHTEYSELLMHYIAPGINVEKLYMMEYPEESDASAYGVIKPAATQALFDLLNRGTAILSYIGHGSPNLWAQERLLDQSRGDINFIDTGNRLPIWIAATCSWGHFDEIDNEAFSEEIIRSKANGAAAIISTSRAISVIGNANYVTAIFRKIFPNYTVTDQPIGYVLQAVKTGYIEGELFHLFGDPAMPLPLPAETVSITGINPDTIRTLEPATFTGTQNISNQGGTGFVIVQDADRTVTRDYVIASQNESLTYTLPGGILFRGQFSVTSTDFSSQIRIPKDITYSSDPGKMIVYFQSNDDKPLEALGYRNQLLFTGGGGTSDNTGPLISFETATGRQLQSNDHLKETDGLKIRISDPTGINMAGEVGHGIILTDNINEEENDITVDFLYDLNSITTGTVDISRYITNRNIDYTVTAWDNANNPSENNIILSLSQSEKLRLYQVLNFPNPFSNSTQFTFEITADAEVMVSIYTLGGRKIKTIEREYFAAGYHHLDWDGRDDNGGILANGVYLYKLEARGADNKTSVIGKLAKYQ